LRKIGLSNGEREQRWQASDGTIAVKETRWRDDGGGGGGGIQIHRLMFLGWMIFNDENSLGNKKRARHAKFLETVRRTFFLSIAWRHSPRNQSNTNDE
jgi:hypothetical protein